MKEALTKKGSFYNLEITIKYNKGKGEDFYKIFIK